MSPKLRKRNKQRPIILKKDTKEQKRTLKNLKQNILVFSHFLPVSQEWLDDEEIAKIESDPTVISAVSIRKSATLKKELSLDCEDELIKKELENSLSYEFRTQVLDTVLQGFSVFELNWYEKEFLYFPTLVERDYRMFSVKDDSLIFDDVIVDEYKAIYLTSRAKFNSALGRPLYNTLFWLRKFKAASLEFWVEFLERFGSPWVVGKTDGDKDTLAGELYNMLGGDIAVVDENDSIDLKVPSDKGAFKELLSYIDNQIWQSIIGSNLTAHVEGGSHAAAKTHKEVSEDISMSDSNLLTTAIGEVIQKFKKLNHIEKEITFKLKDKDDPNIELAKRDATLKSILPNGYEFEADYLAKTYKIDITKAKEVSAKLIPNKATQPKPLTYQEEQLLNFDMKDIKDEFEEVYKIVQNVGSYEEALKKIEEWDNPSFEKALESIIFANGVLSELE